jgi:hypothetical protein
MIGKFVLFQECVMKNSKAVLTIVAALLMLSASAGAAVVIQNAGFEDPVLSDGAWNYAYVGWGTSDDGWVGTWNPDATGAVFYGYGGIAPEGENVGWAGGSATEAYGLGQVLAETLAPGMTYTLTVEVGHNYYYPLNGYQIQLLAADTLLAEDDSTLTIAKDTFETSTVTYTYDPVHSTLVGEPLEIRLIAKAGSDEVDFDNVVLTAIPEPATLGLLGMGVLALIRRKRK